jgi:hypothetical protein
MEFREESAKSVVVSAMQGKEGLKENRAGMGWSSEK